MKRIIVALFLAFCLCCGGALPALTTAVNIASTIGELINLFEHEIDPQYQEANQICAEQIAAAVYGTPNYTAVSAACASLTDAYLGVQHLVEQYKGDKADRSAPLDEEGNRRLGRWYAKYADYKAVVVPQ
jgi:hypothetical protein